MGESEQEHQQQQPCAWQRQQQHRQHLHHPKLQRPLALQGSNTFKVCVQQVCYVRAVSAVCLCRSAVHKALYQGSFAVAAQLLAAGGSLEAADNQVGKRCIMVFWKGGVCVLSSL